MKLMLVTDDGELVASWRVGASPEEVEKACEDSATDVGVYENLPEECDVLEELLWAQRQGKK
jgi:hypothetical protein